MTTPSVARIKGFQNADRWVRERGGSAPRCPECPPQHGPGALPGPAVPALPRRLHLRQDERHPLRFPVCGLAQRLPPQQGVHGDQPPEEGAQPQRWEVYPVRRHSHPLLPVPQIQRALALVPARPAHARLRGRAHVLAAHGHSDMHERDALDQGKQVSENKTEQVMSEVKTCVQLFEDKFLKDKKFITGDYISLADLVALEGMMQPMGSKHDIFSSSHKLTQWRVRVELQIGSGLFSEAHERLMNLGEWDCSTLDPSVKEKIIMLLEKYK